MRVLVCSFVMISNPWLLIRLKLPSMSASPFFSASSTRLYKLMLFTLILSPSIATFRGIPFAALCTTCLLSTRQYIFGLSNTNSVMRCPLCSSLKMGPGSFLLKLRKDENEGNLLLYTFCRNSSRVAHRSNSCFRVQRNQTTCTSRTSCERCFPCHSVVQ